MQEEDAMLHYLPVQVEVVLYVAGVVILLIYALATGNGWPAQESNGRRRGQPMGTANAGGLPVVLTLEQANPRLCETLAMHWQRTATATLTPTGPVPASAPKRVWEYAGTTDIQTAKPSGGARRSRVLMSLQAR